MVSTSCCSVCRRYRPPAGAGRDRGQDTVRTDQADRGPGRPDTADQNPPAAPAAPAATAAAVPVVTAPAPQAVPGWGQPTKIPRASAYRHLVIAYGSNFGANKELAERLAERSDFHGFSTEVITLNELADAPPRTEPWLLVIMTSTYTSNPPSNAAAFKAQLSAPGPAPPPGATAATWSGPPQQPMERVPHLPPLPARQAGRARRHAAGRPRYGDVGTPVWERLHATGTAGPGPSCSSCPGPGPRPTRPAVAAGKPQPER